MINPNQLGPYYMDCIGMCGLHSIPWTGKLFIIQYLNNAYSTCLPMGESVEQYIIGKPHMPMSDWIVEWDS